MSLNLKTEEIAGNLLVIILPKRGSVYSIEEDHVDKSLIFCGTEFGVFFSPNKGERWKKLGNGLPTIAVRDIAIQKDVKMILVFRNIWERFLCNG